MLDERRRKRAPATTVYAFDDTGTKVRMSPQDFGARHQERLGSNISGLGLPQPTQFIVVPTDLMSADEVVSDMIEEKQTLAWRINVAKKAIRSYLDHAGSVVGRWLWLARVEIGKHTVKIRESIHRMQADDTWGADVTEIVTRPPPLKRRRRPSVV